MPRSLGGMATHMGRRGQVSVTEISPRNDDFERTPPHDVAAEQCVLGGMLLSKDAISDVIEVIRPTDHYRPAHQLVHEAILDLYGRGEPADAITVANELTRRGEIARVGGGPYLHTLIASVPTAANAGYYARIVRERAVLRRLVEAGTRIVQFGYAGEADADDLVDRAQAEVYAVTDRRGGEDYQSLSEIMPGALDEIEAIGSHGGGLTGVPTGFADLDALTNGLHPGQMVVIAARPAVGKALALDTPLPTPSGWTTIGEVRVGGELIGADGKPTRVVAATEVMHGRPCYEVEFDDDTIIIADENHQWLTWSRAYSGRPGACPLNPPQVVTTGEIARAFDRGTALGPSRYAVALTAQVELAHAGRPVPVYAAAMAHAERLPDDRWRYITDVRAVPSQPVRCVQVDSRDHLYLAGRGMIPTHNSTLAMDFARAAAIKNGMTTVLFSLEMGRNEITMRLLSAEARVPLGTMRTGQMNDDDWARLARRMSEVADAPLFIDDSPNMSMMEIRAKCRRLKQRHDLKFVIIDYLQLMSSPKRVENRQQEVSEMSRSLKLLAKELDVPVVALSQLNRGSEQRTDKKPLLSDLRESGCLTVGTRILRADTGSEISLGDLLASGERNIPVWSLDDQLLLVPRTMTHAFPSGIKEVFRVRLTSGREVEATGNHPFFTLDGWRALSDLKAGSRVAIPRNVPAPLEVREMPEPELVMLAHLLGDGSFVRNQQIRYASTDEANLAAVTDAAMYFGITAVRDDYPAARCTALRLSSPHHTTHGRRNPIAVWLDSMSLFGLRSHEKFIPPQIFSLSQNQLALFLRHLWATDGSVTVANSGAVRVYYGTTSERLARELQILLLRFGIIARLRAVGNVYGNPQWTVDVTGVKDQGSFLNEIGAHGDRGLAVVAARRRIAAMTAAGRFDTIPSSVWERLGRVMRERSMSLHRMQVAVGSQSRGDLNANICPTRTRIGPIVQLLGDAELEMVAMNDVFWDTISSIESIGHQPVYDATVLGTHNFVVNGINLHNSIEQDSDVVILLHREDMYEKESPRAGEADLIVAKHRNGPTMTVTVAFQGHYSRFVDMAPG
jgi:replicative DNA helicase